MVLFEIKFSLFNKLIRITMHSFEVNNQDAILNPPG